MIPSWTETIGDLRAAEGVQVHQRCDRCQVGSVVDLDALIAEFGPLYSLWNRRPPCPAPGCGGRIWYRAQPRNYFHKILDDAPDHLVDEIHQRWKATLPREARDALPVIPMLSAAGLCVAVSCARCALSAHIGPLEVRAWGERVTTLDLAARLRCREGCGMALDLVPLESIAPADRPRPG